MVVFDYRLSEVAILYLRLRIGVFVLQRHIEFAVNVRFGFVSYYHRKNRARRALYRGIYQNPDCGDHTRGRLDELGENVAYAHVLHTVRDKGTDDYPQIDFDEFIHTRTRPVGVEYAFYHTDIDKQNAYGVYFIVLGYRGVAKGFTRALQNDRTHLFAYVGIVDLFQGVMYIYVFAFVKDGSEFVDVFLTDVAALLFAVIRDEVFGNLLDDSIVGRSFYRGRFAVLAKTVIWQEENLDGRNAQQ